MKTQLIIGESLRNIAARCPDKTAIVFEDRRFTFAQFNARVNRLANGLLELGLKKGDHVAVLLFNCNEILELMMAAGKNGMVAVPVNFRFVAREIEYVVTQSDTRALVVGAEFVDRIAAIRNNLPSVEHWIAVGDRDVPGMLNYEDFLGRQSPAEPDVEVLETDPWYIGYTSGTTGFPKGALSNHRSRVLPSLYMTIEYGLRDTDVQLMTMPLFHGNGLLYSLTGLQLGNTLCILRHFDPEGVLRAIHTEKTSYASMVPTMYEMILSLPAACKERYDVSAMRVLICSSSPLLTKTKEGILSFFHAAELNEMYGSSEAGVVTNLKHRDQTRKTRSVGQVLLGVQAKLCDLDGREVARGEVGELYTFSYCFSGYYKMPDATRAAFRDGWFSAGDMARMDEEGYLYIVDRKSDMIISGGENIYPVEIEEVLSRHPAVSEIAVIGIPDPTWGESVHAVIVLHPRERATPQDIMDYCLSRLAPYKRPRSVAFVDSLPKNPTGKVLKRLVREQYWQEQDIKV